VATPCSASPTAADTNVETLRELRGLSLGVLFSTGCSALMPSARA
jgi:hypothetical protein